MSERTSAPMRFLGLLTGMAFGSLLQRGQLGRQDVILDQLLLRDHLVIKTMGTAVAVGAVTLELLVRKGLVRRKVSPMKAGGIISGASLFGAGLALVGYCPGTDMTAVGVGRKDALAGALGMLTGQDLALLLKSAEDFGLAQYTDEQEADELSLEWITGLGIEPAAAVEAQLQMAERRSADGYGEVGEIPGKECRVLYQSGWKNRKGEAVLVPVGTWGDDHHSQSFRAFNVDREIKALGYQKDWVQRQVPTSPAWRDLVKGLR